MAPGANSVPGFPQDHFPVLDELVEKPETYGLAKGWTGPMMGMMTLLRVLEPEVYDRIQSLRRQPKPEQEHQHQHS